MLTQSVIYSIFQNKKVLNYIDDVFQKYDTDKSGFLSRMQFGPAINSILDKFGVQTCCTQDMIDIFDILDVNGDQTISKQQFTAFIGVINYIIEKHGKSAIKNDLSWVKQSLK